MIKANEFLELCKRHQIDFFSGTPCSYLKPLINAVIDHDDIDYFGATNEGDAVAMVCGAYLLQRKGVVMFQNSGLGNAVNPITSLSFPFRFPYIIIVTHRGQPDGPPDEPQHELMGQITEEMLDTMKLKWTYFPDNMEDLTKALNFAVNYMEDSLQPYVFVLRKGTIEAQELKKEKPEIPIGVRNVDFHENLTKKYSERFSRTEALKVIVGLKKEIDGVIATTGKTGRELYTLSDSANNLYMVGSMGCASSFALGAALCDDQKRWLVIDGDAAVLMRMGNLALVGSLSPRNLIHLVLDNEVNDSTGGQMSISSDTALAGVALACGYKHVYSTDKLEDLEAALIGNTIADGPVFIHFRIKKGSPKDLGRPKIKPFEVKERLMKYLAEN